MRNPSRASVSASHKDQVWTNSAHTRGNLRKRLASLRRQRAHRPNKALQIGHQVANLWSGDLTLGGAWERRPELREAFMRLGCAVTRREMISLPHAEGGVALGEHPEPSKDGLAVVATFVHAYEEPTLSARYGEEYAAYRRAVPGWWPRLRA
jgi:hypothetical protein